jgi:hypothetical protein
LLKETKYKVSACYFENSNDCPKAASNCSGFPSSLLKQAPRRGLLEGFSQVVNGFIEALSL